MSPDQRWKTSISPTNIRVPEDVAELDLVMGRPDSRVLTHKGIELLGLFYNSSEVQDLRRRHGATLKVDIRVDESDIGYIFVIAPDSPQYFRVPALDSEYANGLSSWQHDLFRKQAREQMHENNSIGWLKAQREIRQLVEQDLSTLRKTSHKKHGRFLEDSRAAESKNSIHVLASKADVGTPQPDPLQNVAAETYSDNASAASSPRMPIRFGRIHQERQRHG